MKTGRDENFFNTKRNIYSLRICSHHFLSSDFLTNPCSGKRRLQQHAVPSQHLVGSTDDKQGIKEKHNLVQEGYDQFNMQNNSQQIVTIDKIKWESLMIDNFSNWQDQQITNEIKIDKPLLCNHRFSLEILREISLKTNRNVFKHYTGFTSYEKFMIFLHFILPGLNRSNILYWGTKQCEKKAINAFELFDDNNSTRTYTENISASKDDTVSYESRGRKHNLNLTRI